MRFTWTRRPRQNAARASSSGGVSLTPCDQRVLEGRAAIRALRRSRRSRARSSADRDAAHAGHQAVSGLLHGGVERDGEGELLGFLGEARDARDDPAGGDGEVPSADAESGLGRVQEAERAEGGVVVRERLPLAHGHGVGDPRAEVLAHEAHLVDHLAGAEVAREPRLPGRAERASHRASCLRRVADGEAVAFGQTHGLDRDAVGELRPGTCACRRTDRGRSMSSARGSASATGELDAQSAAGRSVISSYDADAAVVQPGRELGGAVARLAEFGGQQLSRPACVQRLDPRGVARGAGQGRLARGPVFVTADAVRSRSKASTRPR